MPKGIKTAANVAHVREVSLIGSADAGYWRDRLQAEKLSPIEKEGRAQLLIVAAEAKFLGVRFCEVSFSVLVSPTVPSFREAAYLVQAYNTQRLFAFCERVLFSTPYDHGRCQVATAFPASLEVQAGSKTRFRASIGSSEREPSQVGDAGWAGPIYLPKRTATVERDGKWFYGQLQGLTRTYPFLKSQDEIEIHTPGNGFLQALVDSNFRGEVWSVRDDANHIKSKTYRRSALPAIT